MLAYSKEPVYELAFSGGVSYAYVTYIAYAYECSMTVMYLSLMLSVSSIWFHTTKAGASYWVDQIVLNLWILVFIYESYLRSWIAVVVASLAMLYGILMFYIGQRDNTYTYHPSRVLSIFFHITVHALSAMLAIIIITLFPIPK